LFRSSTRRWRCRRRKVRRTPQFPACYHLWMRALLLVLLILGGQAHAADAVLAPGGTLRAAYIVANLAQARLDSSTGTVTGVIADITREMGRRAGVPVVISPLPT